MAKFCMTQERNAKDVIQAMQGQVQDLVGW
jgi:hypothetical protein